MSVFRCLMIVWLSVFILSDTGVAVQLPRLPSQVGVMAKADTLKSLKSKFVHGFKNVAAALVISCAATGFISCEQRGASKMVAEILGEKGPYQVDLQVMIDGVLYEGYLSQDATGTYIAEIADESGPIVFIEHTDTLVGMVVADHVNVDREVYIIFEEGGRYLIRYGAVSRVFENSYHEILIDREVYTNIDIASEITVAELNPANIVEDRMLAMPYFVLAYQKAPVGKGGFEFVEGQVADGYVGAVLLGHADIDRPVHLTTVIDGQQVDLYGTVNRVFDNGYYEITVTAEAVAGGDPVAVDHRDIVSHEDVPLDEGGFVFTDAGAVGGDED